MKKLFILMQLTLAAVAYSSYASADHGHGYYDHPRHHHHHHRHHHGYYGPAPYYREEVIVYAPPPVVQYYPQPQVNYYPAPAPRGYYDQRSGSGLVGGMLGSAFGYEIGRGDPIAAGLGAAAGSYMGNRY